jgi:hypothetical protein
MFFARTRPVRPGDCREPTGTTLDWVFDHRARKRTMTELSLTGHFRSPKQLANSSNSATNKVLDTSIESRTVPRQQNFLLPLLYLSFRKLYYLQLHKDIREKNLILNKGILLDSDQVIGPKVW